MDRNAFKIEASRASPRDREADVSFFKFSRKGAETAGVSGTDCRLREGRNIREHRKEDR